MSILGAGQQVIDIHTHVVPASIPGYLGLDKNAPWPSIVHHRSCCAQVMISGKVFREIEDSSWNTDRRIHEMTEMSVTTQVLSPMPELMSYWMEPDDAAHLAHYINDDIARMVSNNPARFRGLGMVPLQSLDAALLELDRLMNVLKLDGVEIGTNVGGRPIGDPRFEPFFAACDAADAVVFVHPLRAIGLDRLVGPPSLEQIIAFPCETAFAIASLITSGVLNRHPRLKLVFSHGGGTFGQVLPRLQHAWTFIPGLQERTGGAPMELAKSLYFDTLVYSPIALKFLIDLFGVSRIVIGTDYPYSIMDRTPLANVETIALDPAAVDSICHANAGTLLQRGRISDHREPMTA